MIDRSSNGWDPVMRCDSTLVVLIQSSIYSLTFEELQNTIGGPGKDFGSMNMDEILKSIWTAEETQNMATAGGAVGGQDRLGHGSGGSLQRQGLATATTTADSLPSSPITAVAIITIPSPSQMLLTFSFTFGLLSVCHSSPRSILSRVRYPLHSSFTNTLPLSISHLLHHPDITAMASIGLGDHHDSPAISIVLLESLTASQMIEIPNVLQEIKTEKLRDFTLQNGAVCFNGIGVRVSTSKGKKKHFLGYGHGGKRVAHLIVICPVLLWIMCRMSRDGGREARMSKCGVVGGAKLAIERGEGSGEMPSNKGSNNGGKWGGFSWEGEGLGSLVFCEAGDH
ncbi:hypothetical protein ACFX1X_043844 [Malus domestica]